MVSRDRVAFAVTFLPLCFCTTFAGVSPYPGCAVLMLGGMVWFGVACLLFERLGWWET